MTFYDHVYGSGHRGFVCMMTRSASGELDSERFFEWPLQRENFRRIAAMRSDEDVYYSTSLFSSRKRTQTDDLAKTKILWADADICTPDKFRIPPSAVVQTSPAHDLAEECGPRNKSGKPCNGHYHVTWELDDYYPAQEVQNIARKIAYAHKVEGCDLGWTMTKILRVPGTSNTKFDPPYQIPDATFFSHKYSLDEIAEAYQDVDDLGSQGLQLTDVPELLDPADLEVYVERAGLVDLYTISPVEGQSWSERAYRFQMDLFRFGLNAQEVFTLAENSACNKYNPLFVGRATQTGVTIPKRSDPLGVLWREVQKVQAEFASEIVMPTASDEPQMVELNLMTADERQLVNDNHTFLDEFAEWVVSRHPDIDRKYPPSLAWMALSAVYGNLCYVDSLYGKMFPNIWVMIGGQSTVGHKSAGKSRLLQLVHAVEEQNLTKIDIGSDATAEKLTSVLGDRDKEVSLLHTDEINGFFKEAMTKTYRSGTLERYTELYDGRVPVVLRGQSGSGNKNRATTVFNFLGVGIYRHIVRTLTRENFESGFMIRALWTVGDEKIYERGDSDFQNNPDDPNYGDPQFFRLIQQVVEAQSRSDKDRPLPLRLESDALDRINLWTHKLKMYCLGTGDEVLGAGVDRLRDSVVKCAALLAFHNGQNSIGLFELLVAMNQGEQWFRDLQTILSDVSSSVFGRLLDDVEQFIALGPGKQRPDAAIYKKFGFRPVEFSDVTRVLSAQGRVRRVGKEGKWEVLG